MTSLDPILNQFLPYQLDIIRDKSKKIIVEKSRRIGISFALAFKALISCLDDGNNCYYTANHEEGAKRFIADVIKFGEGINRLTGMELVKLSTATTLKVELHNGAKIVGMTSNPSALRGFGGHMYCDEAAFAKDFDELVAAAQPVSDWGGQFIICSTHNGINHPFFLRCHEARNGKGNYSHHRIDIFSAVAAGLAQKRLGLPQDGMTLEEQNDSFISAIRKDCDDLTWNREYCCNPTAAGYQIVSPEMYDRLAKIEVPEYPDPSTRYNALYVGIDIGRSRDMTVCWALDYMGDDEEGFPQFKTVSVKIMENTPIPEQIGEFRRILNHPSVEKCNLDQGFVGITVLDELRDEFGWIINPIAFTSSMKHKLCELVRKYVSHERIILPKDNKIRADVVCVEATPTKSGLDIKYDGRSSFGHGDCFFGLALALMAGDRVSRCQLFAG